MKDSNVILSFYPNGRGVGYAAIDMPQKLLDSGFITRVSKNPDKTLGKITQFIDIVRPKVVILREAEISTAIYDTHAVRLLKKIMKIVEQRQIPLHRYSRQQIRDTFDVFGTKSKYEIAQKIAEWFPVLKVHTPRIRKPWKHEDYCMAVFDAVALAVTHQHLSE